MTLQSFLWSPRVSEKGTKSEVEALTAACQQQLQEQPHVTMEQLSTASAADLAGVMRRATSGEGGSIDASVKRVVIGKVRKAGAGCRILFGKRGCQAVYIMPLPLRFPL